MEARNLKITGLTELSAGHYLVELENSFSTMPLPVQFVHIKVPPFFLRRPFSIAGGDAEKIRVLFRVAGEGTRALSCMEPGDELNVIGPLGTPFPVREEWKKAFIVAGGTGAAPLLFLSSRLLSEGREALFFYGAREAGHIMFRLLPPGVDFIFTTQDGSYGEKGLVTGPFEKMLRDGLLPDVIYAGGPHGLLKNVAGLSASYRVPAFVTLENRMACGTGLCYGCVTKIRSGDGWDYRRVCKDGPVFDAADIEWEES